MARAAVAPANFLDWRERSHAFDAMASAEPFGFYYQGKSGAEYIQSWNVSEDYFPIFGTPAFIGRAFQHADYEKGAPRTQEIGVRIAAGARGIDVIGMVMVRGLALACAGIVGGVLASAALTQLLRQMLWSVAARRAELCGGGRSEAG